jgi:putative DNA primase/helicase
VKEALKDIITNPPIRNRAIDKIMLDLQGQLLFNDKKFVTPRLAGNILFENFDENDLLGDNRGFLVVSDTKEILWDNGRYYKKGGEELIAGIIQKALRNFWKKHYRDETLNWIKDYEEIQVDRDKLDSKPTEIVLQNCVYDILTGKTKDFSPNNLPTTVFPITYDPKAKCPRWLKFLEEVNYAEDIPVVQEMFGYCFYKPYIFQVAFMLVGGGANGKGVTLRVLSALLGKDNICTIPLQQICKVRFLTIELYNKYANICGDLTDNMISDVGLFKMMTGGDLLSGEMKHIQGTVNFLNTAKGVYSCNVIPECKDKTYAYKRRWVVLEYPNVFIAGTKECNPFLTDELLEELPGIFNWLMEGLRRLLKQWHFSPHRTFDDVEQYMKENQDPIIQFCKTCIQSGDKKYTREQLYKYHKEYCLSVGLPVSTQTMFTQRMKQNGPSTLTECRVTVVKKGKRKEERGWTGIEYIPPLPKAEDITDQNSTLDVGDDE